MVSWRLAIALVFPNKKAGLVDMPIQPGVWSDHAIDYRGIISIFSNTNRIPYAHTFVITAPGWRDRSARGGRSFAGLSQHSSWRQ